MEIKMRYVRFGMSAMSMVQARVRLFVFGLVLLAFGSMMLGVATAQQGSPTISSAAIPAVGGAAQPDLSDLLSGSGKNALKWRRGDRPALGAQLRAGPAISIRDAVLGRSNVRVNDPNQDLFAASDLTSQSEPAVAAYSSGSTQTVIVVFNDSGDPTAHAVGATFGLSFIGYGRSTDGGATFTDMGGIFSPNLIMMSDPALVANRAGEFYFSALGGFFEDFVVVQKSVDGGLSWSNGSLLQMGADSFPDKPFMAVDNSAGASSGNVYVTWTEFRLDSCLNVSSLPDGSVPIVFTRSTDGGASFSPPVQLSAPGIRNQGSEPVVGPNGEIYVTWLQLDPPGIMVVKSTDGGLSFNGPSLVTPVEPIGFGLFSKLGGLEEKSTQGTLAGNFRVNSFPRIDVNPVNGQVYIVFNANPPGPDGADIFLTRSTDGGVTWFSPIRVNDDNTTADQWFPDLAVNKDGNIRIFWYDRRRAAPGDLHLDVYGTSSTDGGVSFTPNTLLSSPGGMLPAVGYDGEFSRTYMGDYNDIKVEITPTGPGTRFVSAWSDFSRVITTDGGTRSDQDVVFAPQSVR